MRVVRNDRPVRADIEVRPATATDGPAIAELFRRVPSAGPRSFTWVDHGDQWWDAVGDRPGRRVFVARRGHRLVGVHAVTTQPARLDDRPLRLAHLGPTRIDPAVQGTGVFGALRDAVVEHADHEAAEPYALVPVGDLTRRLPLPLRRWPIRVHRAAIDCGAVATVSADARRIDVAEAAALLADTRAGAALAAPDDHAALCRRLVDDRSGYGIDRLLTNGDAVVGVARWIACVRDERRRRTRRQVTAWDVGAKSSVALESVVRAWCARLADDGVDDLVVWSCAGDLVHRTVRPLARSTTPHVIDLGLTPPFDVATRGIQLDAALL